MREYFIFIRNPETEKNKTNLKNYKIQKSFICQHIGSCEEWAENEAVAWFLVVEISPSPTHGLTQNLDLKSRELCPVSLSGVCYALSEEKLGRLLLQCSLSSESV